MNSSTFKPLITVLFVSALAACTSSPKQTPVKQRIIPQPVVEDVPIGSVYVRVSDQYKHISSVPKESVAITMFDPRQSRWYAVGPVQMVSTGEHYEAGVLTKACGDTIQTQYLVNYGHYRIHRCIGRPLKNYDIDVAKMYNLPLYY